MNGNWARLSVIATAIIAAAALRLLPHPPNFTPIGAMALFGGANLRPRWLAFGIPLVALVLSDAALGFYSHMAIVYASFALIVALGRLALSRISPFRVGAAAVASSVLFYLITNFGEWLHSANYSHTFEGLTTCYIAAVPFFQNTLAGDLFYSSLFFGGFALLQHGFPALRVTQKARLPH